MKRYGILRLVRDACGVSGMVEVDGRGQITGIFLNRGSTLSDLLIGALKSLLRPQDISVELVSI